MKSYKDKNGEWLFKKTREFFFYSKYIGVKKHHFREAFEKDDNSYGAKYCYPKMKSLIYLDLTGGRALIISEGDKVQFLPFGGFIVFTDNNFTRGENRPLLIYKEIFIPNFFNGKIKDIEKEKEIRYRVAKRRRPVE